MAAILPAQGPRPRLSVQALALVRRFRRDPLSSRLQALPDAQARARRGWLVLGIVALLLALIARLPVALVYGWLAPKLPPSVQLQGVSGTLLSGGAAGVSLDGRPALTDVHWHLKPLWLLAGRLTLDVEAGNPADMDGISFTTTASRSFLGTIRLANTQARGSLRAAAALAGYPYVPVAGTLEATLPALRVDHGAIRGMTGQVRLSDLRWSLSQPPIDLGAYRLDLSTDPGGPAGPVVHGLVGTDSGPLDTDGGLTLGPDRAYAVALGLRPKAGAPGLLTTLVQSAGPQGDRGFYRLNRQGTY